MAFRYARDDDTTSMKELVKLLRSKGLSGSDIADVVDHLGADPGKSPLPAMDSATLRSLAKRYPHGSKIRNLDKEGNR
jgi:hypothetical protein